MDSKQRFSTVCRHSLPDRFPIDYLAHPETDTKIKRYYGIETEDELLEKLGCDFYYLSCRDISQNESCLPFYKGPKLEMTGSHRVCPFGIRFKRGAYGSKFAVDEAVGGPLVNATSEREILDHDWPRSSWFDFSPLLNETDAHRDKVIIGGMWTGILGDSYRMHGFQNFLLNTALNPDFVKTLVNRMAEVYMEMNESIFSLLRGKLDIWFFGNDFGSQESLLLSRSMFRDIFIDNIARLTKHAHGFNLKVMMHSCGAITEIIPDLIDAGIDIIDPVQVTANGMQPELLKSAFGNKIVFHGGIDTQQVLPNSTPEQVRRHCIDTLNILGRNGGYIFAPSQLLQPGIPVENIAAMYDTAKTYCCNKHPKSVVD